MPGQRSQEEGGANEDGGYEQRSAQTHKMKNLLWEYDVSVDAGSLALRELEVGESLVSSVLVDIDGDNMPELVISFDRDGRIVDLEFLGASKVLPRGFDPSFGKWLHK